MKQQDSLRQHTATYRHGARRDALRSAHDRGPQPRAHRPSAQPRPRRPSAQLITDAVVANYIHDISVRRRGAAGSPDRLHDATHSRSLSHDLEALARS